MLASLIGLITTFLAALNQYLRFRQGNIEEYKPKQFDELAEDVEELEDRVDEQEAILNELRQKQDV